MIFHSAYPAFICVKVFDFVVSLPRLVRVRKNDINAWLEGS